MKKILFIGGTGYIGGPILSSFIQRWTDDPTSLDITALVRSPLKVEKLRALNLPLSVVIGSHEDAELVERLADDADVVFSLADSDYLPAAQSILRGLKRRFQSTGIKPVLIHMSGIGCVADNAQGMFTSDTIYSDTDTAQIESLPATQPHRNVDLTIVEGDSEGYVDTYIVLPPLVHGTPRGILFDTGVQKTTNVLDLFLDVSSTRGAAPIIGPGKNIVGHVDVNELHDLVLLLYNTIIDNSSAVGHGRFGYYFTGNGELSFSEITAALEPTMGPRRELTKEELDGLSPYQALVMQFFGRNWRSRADRAKTLGWRPVKMTEDLFNALNTCVENFKL
ncbi:hypothetical protein FB45DRAFT_1063335 [Roridomyces roridus]|uniref:NAD(P)-binding domain-containing protein n=1 Tax=Roridomyces roridus TaxID=1738132 RepID=A0AAD7BET9_9AGAR|nr:hypothetical protein FB45DRAFT_1063335 [Roridomyces roridus]